MKIKMKSYATYNVTYFTEILRHDTSYSVYDIKHF